MSVTLKQFLNTDVESILKERRIRLPKKVSYEDEEEMPTDDVEADMEDEFGDMDADLEGGAKDTDPSEWSVRPLSDEEAADTDGEQEDPNRQGMIRKIQDAHLVYKRQIEDGAFEELWIYKIGDTNRTELEIRREILAGTDIKADQTKTEDGSQRYELWTSGEVQFVYVTGLPN